VISSFERSLM